MFKKILSLVLVCGLIFSFAACERAEKSVDEGNKDIAGNESIVFAGDYSEIEKYDNQSEKDVKEQTAQISSDEKSEPKQEVSKEDKPTKQEPELDLNEEPVSSEPVSSKAQKQEESQPEQEAVSSKGGDKASNVISRDKAKAIALKHAEVKEKDIYDFDIELDKDKKSLHYDIDFEVGNIDYEYEIDAVSGKVLFSKSEKDDDKKPLVSRIQQPEPEISKSKAEDIALKHAGVKKKDVSEFEIDFDNDDGRKVYEIDFKHGGYEYSYEVNAESGKVVLKEKERD